MQYPFLSRRRRGMASPWLLAGALGLSLLSPLAQATTGPEVQVTASFVIDFEFDWGRDGVYCASCNQGAGAQSPESGTLSPPPYPQPAGRIRQLVYWM